MPGAALGMQVLRAPPASHELLVEWAVHAQVHTVARAPTDISAKARSALCATTALEISCTSSHLRSSLRCGTVTFVFAQRLGLLVGFILAFLLGIFVVHPKIVFAVFDLMSERHARTQISPLGYSKWH